MLYKDLKSLTEESILTDESLSVKCGLDFHNLMLHDNFIRLFAFTHGISHSVLSVTPSSSPILMAAYSSNFRGKAHFIYSLRYMELEAVFKDKYFLKSLERSPSMTKRNILELYK